MVDLDEGRILDGRYQLGSLLAVGGMARVYLASDRVLERPVAVKVLSPPHAQDPVFVERFRREARSAARLSHPNIVAVFDSGTDAGLHYLVMEYVPGQSLAELLARQGRLTPRQAAELGVEVCAALAAAHAQGLVHRDVKPANVLVGDDGRVKVTDFGIVKAAATTLTGTGTVLGTAAYLSPEQAQGGPVDARSDLYSLGCVLYELLCGSPPFGSGADSPPVAVATRHLYQPAGRGGRTHRAAPRPTRQDRCVGGPSRPAGPPFQPAPGMAPLGARGGRAGPGDRAGGVAVARQCQHPGPAGGRARHSTSN